MKNMKKKSFLILAMMVLLLTFAVGGTIAYLVTSTNPVVNTFEPAYVTSVVNEPDWKDGDLEKKNVTISNTGNTSAFIRAAIVVTWQDKDGYTMPVRPVLGTDYDYTLDINTNDWTYNSTDGFYYYMHVVTKADDATTTDTTTNLINSCKPIKAYDDGRKLCVEVIGSAIQSTGIPGETYQNAWTNAATYPSTN